MDKSQLDLMFPKQDDLRYNGGAYDNLSTTHVLEYDDGTYKYMMGNSQMLIHKKFFHIYFRFHRMPEHTMNRHIDYK